MPKRQVGSRSVRKKGASLAYARRESISLTVAPALDENCSNTKTVAVKAEPTEQTDTDCSLSCKTDIDPSNQTAGTITPPKSSEPKSPEPINSPPKGSAPKSSKIEPKRFGLYDLHFELCKDSLSTTYLAKNPALDGFLSLRIFNEKITDSAQVRSIQKAALKAAEITHPNHVCVYDNGLGENQAPYVVSEWIEGETLGEFFLRKKRLDIGTFLNIFNQVGEVLAEAHSRRLYHGNLSPQKIVMMANEIEADVVKVTGFGMPVDPVQNAFYMSPEQCLDKDRLDARSDIYSLGCIMYESLVGRPPTPGSQATANTVDYLHELANQYSKESPEHNALKLLDCIIKRCLHKQPAKRFTSVREVLNALGLVADCLHHPGKQRLPRKAEKLLLFRFLDLFDKKITAALTAYLLLGFLSVKYIGEMQLQRFIDEAQIMRQDAQKAQLNWSAAISQAEALGKPPGMLADLHWELADSYRAEGNDYTPGPAHDKVNAEAIKHYERAFDYYKHSQHDRSNTMSLLGSITDCWLDMNANEEELKRHKAILHDLRGLYNSKNYAACANKAAAFVSNTYDNEVYKYACDANMALGKKAKPQEALKYFARATYFYQRFERDNPGYMAVQETLEKMGYVPQLWDTHQYFANQALLAGDLPAAKGFASLADTDANSDFNQELDRYLNLRNDTYSYVQLNPNRIAAFEPLIRARGIVEKAYGKNSPHLSTVLNNLAKCYRLRGDKTMAIATYRDLIEIMPDEMLEYDGIYLSYADLLCETGKPEAACQLLERRLLNNGSLDVNNPLYIRLILAYREAHNPQAAADALAESMYMLDPVKQAVRQNPFPTPLTFADPFQHGHDPAALRAAPKSKFARDKFAEKNIASAPTPAGRELSPASVEGQANAGSQASAGGSASAGSQASAEGAQPSSW